MKCEIILVFLILFAASCNQTQNRNTSVAMPLTEVQKDSIIKVIDKLLDEDNGKLALQEIQILMEDDSTDAKLYMMRGCAYTCRGNVDAAKRDFYKTIELNYKRRDAYFDLAFLYTSVKDYKTAILYLDTCVIENPYDTIAIEGRKNLLAELKKNRDK